MQRNNTLKELRTSPYLDKAVRKIDWHCHTPELIKLIYVSLMLIKG
jgi:hypothetical protein